MAIRKRRSFSEIIDEYFRDLEEWAEDFGEPFTGKPSWNLRNSSLEPLRETTVTPTEVLVTLDLPFTDKGTVKVKPIGTNAIEIDAKMRRKIRLHELGVTHCKGEFHRYHAHMRIPVQVNMSKMKIDYKKGLLEIHLPRKH
jgi:HSP20 family molecular chaperone IbpA